jgi:acetylornithine deacetylase
MVPSTSDLLAGIDVRASLDLLSHMIRFKSYSETGGEVELAHFMADQMRGIGLEVELQTVEGSRVNAIGRLAGAGGGRSLLFNGHLDTNPVGEGWSIDPWGGLVDDQFIYGIGVSNMKSGDAAYFMALKTLLDAGVRLKGDLTLTYVVGELQYGVGTLAAIAQGVTADYFINCEPTDLAALTMHAAAFTFIVELTGITRHMSKREQSVDAILAACDLIPRLNSIQFSGAKSDEHASINRAHVGVVRGALGREFMEWRPALIGDFVRLSGSGRYAPGHTEQQVLADMRAVLDDVEGRFPGLKAELIPEHVAGRPMMPPFEVPRDARIVRTVNAAYKGVRGEDQPTGAVLPSGFFGSDAAHLATTGGIEGIVCGPGGRYNTMPDEKVDIVDYLDAIRIYLLAILDICEAA